MKANWIIEDFKKALTQLDKALAFEAENDLIRAGCLQYFEFTFELAWKSVQFVLIEEGLPECHSPKSCLKKAYSMQWIQSETTWLSMLEVRNRLVHTYDVTHATKSYGELRSFIPEFKILLENLSQIV